MLQSLSGSAQKVQDALDAHGVPLKVVQLAACLFSLSVRIGGYRSG